MPKSLFDDDCGMNDLSKVIDMFNNALTDAKNVKTVEELQGIINNLTRVINEIKKSLAVEKSNIIIE
jgi:hypothetical protein